MPVSVYDNTARHADEAHDNIEAAVENGHYKEAQQYIDTLYSAASEFETEASRWREMAEKEENKLVEEGII